MLILEANRDELLKPFQTVAGVVEKRSTLPVLSNVLIEGEGGRTTILGTDLEIQISTDGPQMPMMSDFRLTVNAKKVHDILKALPVSAQIAFEYEQNKLTIKSGKGRYDLQTLPAEDFPLMSVTDSVVASFHIKQGILKNLISQVEYAMAKQDIRFYLNGLLLQVEGNILRLVATDGHRLAYTQCEIESNLPACEVILPRKTIAELEKILTFPEESINVDLFSNQVRFTMRDAVIISKIVEGKFPDYNRVIPQDNDKIFQLSCREFLSALERASIFANEKFHGINLGIHPGQMSIESRSSEHEQAREILEIAYQGAELEMGFNVNYLKDVLIALKDTLESVNSNDDVRMAFGDATKSVLITIPNDHNFKYIVMPMRI